MSQRAARERAIAKSQRSSVLAEDGEGIVAKRRSTINMDSGPKLDFDFNIAERIWRTFDISKSGSVGSSDGKIDFFEFCAAMESMHLVEG